MRLPASALLALLLTVGCAHARPEASWVTMPGAAVRFTSTSHGSRQPAQREGVKLEADNSVRVALSEPEVSHLASGSVARARVVAQRLRFLDDRFDAGRRAGNTWWIGWLTSYGALAVGQALAAWGLPGTAFDSYRPQLVVGSLSAAIGAIGILAMPWPGSWARARDGDLDGAERRLHVIADGEALGHSWLAHLAAVLVNGVGALVLGFGFGMPIQAALGFVVGMGVAELQIFTQPTAGIHDEVDYRGWSPAPAAGPTIGF